MRRKKVSLVKKLFAERPPHRVIIFASSKLKVKDMAIALGRAGFKVGAMHSVWNNRSVTK